MLTDVHLSRKSELINPDNDNANCRLWIQPDNTLFKEYVLFDTRTSANIKNVRDFSHGRKRRALSKIIEIALPLDIILNPEKTIIGYTMEHFNDACTLSEILNDKSKNDFEKKDVLLQLANVIMCMPSNIHIGDLHGRNVIIDKQNRIHIIDVDGFSQKHNQISCPVQYITFSEGNRKYWNGEQFMISKETDIYCFIVLLLNWLSGVDMIRQYTFDAIMEYLNYLERISADRELVTMLKRPFEYGKNFISIEAIRRIDSDNVSEYHYEKFLEKAYMENEI